MYMAIVISTIKMLTSSRLLQQEPDPLHYSITGISVWKKHHLFSLMSLMHFTIMNYQSQFRRDLKELAMCRYLQLHTTQTLRAMIYSDQIAFSFLRIIA